MKNNTFFKTVTLLLIGGFITKIISMIIKIVLARSIGSEGMGIYMLTSPTFILLISLAQLGMPVAISKLVAEGNRNNKNLVFSVIPIALFLNMIIIVFLILFAPYISHNLLNEDRCYWAIVCIGFVLPFISISSILRGYFFGKQKMLPHVVSNITEDIVRLLCLMIGLPFLIKKGIEYAVAYIILVNIISELTSILILFFFIPKNFKISINDLKPDKNNIKQIFGIGIPTTMSKIIGSIGYFFEPIILTYGLIKCGYDNSYIVNEYGIINGYIMPLILLPSFFTLAISQALIPSISKAHSKKNYKYIWSRIKLAIFLSLLIGIPATLIFEFVPSLPMKFVYNNVIGLNYLRILAPIALFHYIQSPLTASLQAMGKAREAMNGTIQATIIRTCLLFVLSFCRVGMWALIWATAINIIYVTIHQYICIKKILNLPYLNT